MKYIMFESKSLGQRFPIIFPEHFVHIEVKQALQSLGIFKDLKVVNAGNIRIEECITTGKSSTLELESDPNDKYIIELHDVLHGMNF